MNQILSSDALLGATVRPSAGRIATASQSGMPDSGFGALIVPEKDVSAGGDAVTAVTPPVQTAAAPVAQARPALAFWSQLSPDESHGADPLATPAATAAAVAVPEASEAAAGDLPVDSETSGDAAETALISVPVQPGILQAMSLMQPQMDLTPRGQKLPAAPEMPVAAAAQPVAKDTNILPAMPGQAASGQSPAAVTAAVQAESAVAQPSGPVLSAPQSSPIQAERALPTTAASRPMAEASAGAQAVEANAVPLAPVAGANGSVADSDVPRNGPDALAADALGADGPPRMKKDTAAPRQPQAAGAQPAAPSAMAAAAGATAVLSSLPGGTPVAAPANMVTGGVKASGAAGQFTRARLPDAAAAVTSQAASIMGTSTPAPAPTPASAPFSAAIAAPEAQDPRATTAGAAAAQTATGKESQAGTAAVGAAGDSAFGAAASPQSSVAGAVTGDPAASADPDAAASAPQPSPATTGPVPTGAAPVVPAATAARASGALRIAGAETADSTVKASAEHGARRRAKDVAADDAAVTQTRMTETRSQDHPAGAPAAAQADDASAAPKDAPSPLGGTVNSSMDTGRGPEGARFDALSGMSTASAGPDRSAAGAPLTTAAGVPLHGPATAQAVAVQIAGALSSLPDRPVELALSPEELGKVRLTLSHGHDGGISVAVQAERPETLDLMRRNIDQLASDFRDMGYSSIDFSFSGGQNSPGQQHPEAPPESFAASGDRGNETAATPVVATAADPIRLRLADDSGLDMRL
ncbi:flagellar hook-length control protein FliK [Phaeovulum sp. W22_SRMD_FR3]|uniref:flagellar hook-length control protein FliK n=1 Tax=Phaeovulum sp. W22_SRMD_FR3 TaxID=3240274 RepID=UPI003F986FD4